MCIGMSSRSMGITAKGLLSRLENRFDRVPIALIWGREDKFVPLSLGLAIFRSHPWLNLSVFENTGHCPHDESPKEFNHFVFHWLQTNLVNDQEKV